MNKEALDGTLCRTGFERVCGLLIYSLCVTVVRHTVENTHFCQLSTSADTDKWPRDTVETEGTSVNNCTVPTNQGQDLFSCIPSYLIFFMCR